MVVRRSPLVCGQVVNARLILLPAKFGSQYLGTQPRAPKPRRSERMLVGPHQSEVCFYFGQRSSTVETMILHEYPQHTEIFAEQPDKS